MNKYNKYFNKSELKRQKKRDRKLSIMMLKLKKEMIKYYDFSSFIKMSSYSLFWYVIENLSEFNVQLQEYVINNIINKLNKECLINCYLIRVCYYQTLNDLEKIKLLINSFNKSGLI